MNKATKKTILLSNIEHIGGIGALTKKEEKALTAYLKSKTNQLDIQQSQTLKKPKLK